uniref:Uncharacterized protein n=1 Tax=Solanum demissum TaxID=50514 RepID=Q0KIM4_SOLDE|nr:hypothetical protein SDM1_49t00013 [Solanum demissum]
MVFISFLVVCSHSQQQNELRISTSRRMLKGLVTEEELNTGMKSAPFKTTRFISLLHFLKFHVKSEPDKQIETKESAYQVLECSREWMLVQQALLPTMATSKGSKPTGTLAKTLNQALYHCPHTRLAKSLILTWNAWTYL